MTQTPSNDQRLTTHDFLSIHDFDKINIRTGRILTAAPNPKAHNPAYVLTIDFGPEFGVKTSSAQLTIHYTPEQLVGKLVIAVMNFEPKRVAGVKSEVLVLGVPDEHGAVVLLEPTGEVPLGGRMF
ncbi:MAG: tRNA-binding protein [Gemmatimonadales bacterium]|nr:tRNA-binding protein [Gemmatimonadales bacterium]